ncbi:5405_t:CDS:1 [Racocetra fulgida]|uniref:5405_t:CDS:1 n=1 Tax=Racocetra fulgida TaxID=60492 RepID=A0A9N9BF76_9GLOM|nr:5405_t:CDS:1 [Racocetra fulgida]
MSNLNLDEQPYLNSYLVQLYEDYLPCPKLFPMHYINKICSNDVFSPEVCRAVQKRHDYGEVFNLALKAVRSAVEKGGDSLRRLKRSLNDWFAEEQKLSYTNNDEMENFNPDQVQNPIERRQKGRPPTKRFKSNVELSQSKSKKSTSKIVQNKYGKCESAGHYAPTCKK